ncbi:hypothetical protein [Bacillus sp. B-jedd]|uniref:hypothetical protein n=1 Tax=Bacillus sp. B-jedd TaxID=1476857 RepID=UPI00051564B7|nr:hypothetical protein [Bacillus sp. B-jedd]CEG27686.1 hypothetical protein BN1002_02557 [Bacillus sp. B-jedd]
MLLRHRIFGEANLQLVAKLHEANSWMFLMKLVQVDASPRGKHVPGVEITIKDYRSLF